MRWLKQREYAIAIKESEKGFSHFLFSILPSQTMMSLMLRLHLGVNPIFFIDSSKKTGEMPVFYLNRWEWPWPKSHTNSPLARIIIRFAQIIIKPDKRIWYKKDRRGPAPPAAAARQKASNGDTTTFSARLYSLFYFIHAAVFALCEHSRRCRVKNKTLLCSALPKKWWRCGDLHPGPYSLKDGFLSCSVCI